MTISNHPDTKKVPILATVEQLLTVMQMCKWFGIYLHFVRLTK